MWRDEFLHPLEALVEKYESDVNLELIVFSPP